MKLYKFGSFLALSSVLLGCGGGGTSSNGSSTDRVPIKEKLSHITLYDMSPSKVEWFGSGWKSQVLDNLASFRKGEGLSTNPSTELEPFQDRPVGVVLSGNNVIMSRSDQFNKSLNTLILSDGSELTISGVNGSTLHVEQLLIDSGTVKDAKSQLRVSSGILGVDGTLDGDLHFEQFPGVLYFPDSKTFELKGGRIIGHVTIPSHFTLSGYGTIDKRLTNSGTLSLRSGKTLEVGGGFKQSASGVINVELTDRHDIVLLNAGIESIEATGKISFVMKNASLIKANTKYTIFSANNPKFDINLALLEFKNSLKKTDIELLKEGNEYVVILKKDIQPFVFSKFASRSKLFSKILSVSRLGSYEGVYLRSLQNKVDVIQGMQKYEVGNGLFFTTREATVKNGEMYGFFAMNQKQGSNLLGFYCFNGENKQDLGGYAISSFGQFNLINSFHFGSVVQEDLELFSNSRTLMVKSELVRNFDVGGARVSPKIMVGYEQFLSFESTLLDHDEKFDFTIDSKGVFISGLGLDITSKVNIRYVPVEIFATLNIANTNGPALKLEANEIGSDMMIASAQIGFKAVFDANAQVYGSVKLHSCENVVDQRLEVGFQIRI